HPRRERQLRLRHPPARPPTVRRTHRVDRRHALSRPPPPRTPRPRGGSMADRGNRATPEILPDHPAGTGAARPGTRAVADGELHPRGHLAGVVRGQARPPVHRARITRPASLTEMQPPPAAMSLDQQIDQWRSYLRRRQAIHSVDVAELEAHL